MKSLSLRQINSSVQIGSLRELSGLRQPGPAPYYQLQNTVHDENIESALDDPEHISLEDYPSRLSVKIEELIKSTGAYQLYLN